MNDGPRLGRSARIVKTARARQLRRHMTHAERILWQALRGKRLYGLRFRRQEPIAGFIVDFICFERALVIELDGAGHADAQARAYDAERDAILRAHGLTVLRLPNDEVEQRLPAALERIARACRVKNDLTP